MQTQPAEQKTPRPSISRSFAPSLIMCLLGFVAGASLHPNFRDGGEGTYGHQARDNEQVALENHNREAEGLQQGDRGLLGIPPQREQVEATDEENLMNRIRELEGENRELLDLLEKLRGERDRLLAKLAEMSQRAIEQSPLYDSLDYESKRALSEFARNFHITQEEIPTDQQRFGKLVELARFWLKCNTTDPVEDEWIEFFDSPLYKEVERILDEAGEEGAVLPPELEQEVDEREREIRKKARGILDEWYTQFLYLWRGIFVRQPPEDIGSVFPAQVGNNIEEG